jgi:hypothetical protein
LAAQTETLSMKNRLAIRALVVPWFGQSHWIREFREFRDFDDFREEA